MKSPIGNNESLKAQTISYIIVVAAGIGIATFIWKFSGFITVLRSILSTLFPFLLAYAIAFILDPMVFGIKHLLDKHIFKNHPKPGLTKAIGIIISYIFMLALVSGFIAIVLPQVIQSVQSITSYAVTYLNTHGDDINELINRFGTMIGNPDLASTLKKLLQDSMTKVLTYSNVLVSNILYLGVSVSSFVVQIFIALIGGIYLLIGKDVFARQIKKIMYAFLNKDSVDLMLYWSKRSKRIFSGYISGKLVDSLIIGILCYALTTVLGIDYALLISVIVGITNILPFFGPFIGAIPSILILLMIDPIQALKFGIMILVLQQVDGNVIGPKVLGDSLGISSFWIMIAIVVGGGLFGFIGMLLGVPVFALIYAIIKTVVNRKLNEKGLPTDSGSYSAGSDPTAQRQEVTTDENNA